MDRRALKSERGSVAFELIFVVPAVCLVLFLMLATFRAVEGVWATTIAARLAAWEWRVQEDPPDGTDLLPVVSEMTGEVRSLETTSRAGSAIEGVRLRDIAERGAGKDTLPSRVLEQTSRFIIAQAESRSGSAWGGTHRSTAILVGEMTSDETGFDDDYYQGVVQTVAGAGLLGLRSWRRPI